MKQRTRHFVILFTRSLVKAGASFEQLTAGIRGAGKCLPSFRRVSAFSLSSFPDFLIYEVFQFPLFTRFTFTNWVYFRTFMPGKSEKWWWCGLKPTFGYFPWGCREGPQQRLEEPLTRYDFVFIMVFSCFSHVTQTASWLPPIESWISNFPYGWEEALDHDGKPYYVK